MASPALQEKPLNTALTHAATVGTGWLALTFLARQLIDMSQAEDRKKVDDKLKAYVNAKYPVLTPDPNTRDTKGEEKLLAAGATAKTALPELDEKEAAETDSITGVSKLRSFLEQFFVPMPSDPAKPASVFNYLQSSFGDPRFHPGHTALATATALAGGVAGYKLADKLIDKKREEELATRIAESRNKMDKLLLEEYARTRGMSDKTANALSVDQVMKSFYLTYLAGVAYLTYNMSKSYMDKADPARQRIEALKQLANTQARVRGAPMLIGDIPLPGAKSEKNSKPTAPKSVETKQLLEKQELPQLPAAQQAVDSMLSEDDINKLLAQQSH